MVELIRMPPRGVGFAMPELPVGGTVIAEDIPKPLLPAVSSRILYRPEHMDAVVKDLPETHPAKKIGIFANIETRMQNLRETVDVTQAASKAKLIAAAGLGVTGFGAIGDVLLSGAIGHAPLAILAGLGMAAGIWGLGKTVSLALTQGQIDGRDKELGVEQKRKFLSSGRTVSNRNPVTGAVVEGLPDISDVPEWIRKTLIAVPATGEAGFEMGSNDYFDEKSNHRVVLGAYYMMNCTVTNAMWKRFKGSPPSPAGFDGDDQPVVQVSYHDAVVFAQWVTEQSKGKVKFALPTEAQWERAARGGEANQKWATESGNISQNEANYGRKANGKTVDVYTYKPNALGFYQLSGNVWEWCSDWYSAEYYANSPKENPTGPERGDYRVLRGGSFYSRGIGCRSANRSNDSPGGTRNGWGFRLAAVLPRT